MVGQVTITAGIDIAAAIYLIGAATRILGLPADARCRSSAPLTGWSFQLFVMVLIMIPQVAINVFGIRLDGAVERLQRLVAHRRRRAHRARSSSFSARTTTRGTS